MCGDQNRPHGLRVTLPRKCRATAFRGTKLSSIPASGERGGARRPLRKLKLTNPTLSGDLVPHPTVSRRLGRVRWGSPRKQQEKAEAKCDCLACNWRRVGAGGRVTER